jgi:hypothetical protein
LYQAYLFIYRPDRRLGLKKLSLQKRINQNLFKNRFRLNFTRMYKNVSTLTNCYRFFKFADSSRDFMMYVSTTEQVKMSAIFRVRKLFNLGSRLLTRNRKPKTNYYSKFTYLRIFYKNKIDRIKISPNFAHWENLKFAYFEQ